MFGRKSADRSKQPLIPDPFAVIPIKPEQVELKRDSHGMIHLRLHATPKGLAKKIAEMVGYDYTRKLELDEYGTFYYSHVDGETTLETIVAHMTEKLGNTRKETEKAVILFTKKLMVMNMLALKIPHTAEEAR
ncbi:MAG: hypothetical protein ACYDBB_23760 [Armatimonadota bacterium]